MLFFLFECLSLLLCWHETGHIFIRRTNMAPFQTDGSSRYCCAIRSCLLSAVLLVICECVAQGGLYECINRPVSSDWTEKFATNSNFLECYI
jgi:hypothetical protein